ncbi:MAG: Flp pilus assembly protein CpaB [Actinomycetota bacterium]|nr:MAG: Flp pilus assembly protein CpaB [Actinomycetota bacterium]
MALRTDGRGPVGGRDRSDSRGPAARRTPSAAVRPWREPVVRRHRRLIAVVLFVLAAGLVLVAVRPPSPVTTSVLVTTTALPGGATVRAADVQRRDVPAEFVPAGAVSDPATVDGAVLAGPVAVGEILTLSRFAGAPGATGAVGSGLVAAPVRIADAAAVALVSAGDVVDVLHARSAAAQEVSAAEVVARAVRVVSVPSGRSSGGGGVFGRDDDRISSNDAAGATGALVVLAVDPATSIALAAAAANGRLSLVLRPPGA